MYELIIIWQPENKKEKHIFYTLEQAEQAEYNMKLAFGSQIWTCINYQ